MSSNIQKTKLNMLFLTVSQIVTICFGLIMPRITLMGYGSEINGLINSVTQIISYLSLFEAGIQSVAKQALYKTIGGNDRDGTNSIISAVHHNYRRIGTLYFLFLLGLALAYPFFAHAESLNYISVFLIVLFSGLGSVVTFFFQGKYQILLAVDGKTYVLSLISTTVSILNHLVKIILLYKGVNILYVILAAFVISLLQCILIMTYVTRKYGWLNLKEKPNNDCLKQSKYAFIHQVSAQIFSHIDVLLLTGFCGLKVVSVYSIYKMIVNYLRTVLVIPWDSSLFALGQLYNRDKARFIKTIDSVELLVSTAAFSIFSVAMVLMPPFISIYTKGVTDIQYVDAYLPFLFVFGEILNISRLPMNGVIIFEGHFKQTVWRSVLETVINLVTSVVGVIIFGIYGVLIGTIMALLYRTIDIVFYANKRILNRSPIKTISIHAINILLFALVGYLVPKIGITISSYFDFALIGALMTIIVLSLFFGVLLAIFGSERKMVFTYLRQRMLKLLKKNNRSQ